MYEELNAMEIGSRLKTLRDKNNETIEQVAKSVETSGSAIAMYESGKRIPRDEIKIRIAEHFGVPVESIFFPTAQHES